MRGKSAARRSSSYERANVSARHGDTQSIARNLDAEWRKGTLWAGVGMVAVWGPLMVAHALGWF